MEKQKIICPHCSRKLSVDSMLVERQIRCPACGGVFVGVAVSTASTGGSRRPVRCPRKSDLTLFVSCWVVAFLLFLTTGGVGAYYFAVSGIGRGGGTQQSATPSAGHTDTDGVAQSASAAGGGTDTASIGVASMPIPFGGASVSGVTPSVLNGLSADTSNQVADAVPPSDAPALIKTVECWFSGEARKGDLLLSVEPGYIFLWIRWEPDISSMALDSSNRTVRYSIQSDQCALILSDGTRLSQTASESMFQSDGSWHSTASAFSIPVCAVKDFGRFKFQMLGAKPVPVTPILQPFEMVEGKKARWRWPVEARMEATIEFLGGTGLTKKSEICLKSANGWCLLMTERYPNGLRTDETWDNHPFEILDNEGHLLYAGCSNVLSLGHSWWQPEK